MSIPWIREIWGRIALNAVFLDLDLGPDLLKAILRHGGVEGWNQWISDLEGTGLLNPECRRDSDPPLIIGIDLSDADLAGLVMPGIDLSWCHIAHASFMGSDLRGAAISGDISGVDFTDAQVNDLLLEGCGYERGSPPVGLADDLLAQCHEDDVEPVKASTRLDTIAVDVRSRIVHPRL